MRKFNSLLFNADQRSAKNGASSRQRKLFLASLAALCAAAGLLHAPQEIADPVRIVAFGDSLTAGLGLPAQDAFPSKLAAALTAKGYDVAIVNAGVSGDTTSAALARLDWSVAANTQAVIIEFGANDAFRGGLPAIVSQNLAEIIRRLKARNIEVLLAGIPGARWIDSENYHLTLRFIGDVDHAVARDVMQILGGVERRPFEIAFNGLIHFGGKKPRAVVAVAAANGRLAELQAEHERILQRIGLPPEQRTITPHVALSRVRESSSRAVADALA